MTLRCRTGGMQDRRDTGKVEFGTVGIQFWLDTGILKGYRKQGIQEMRGKGNEGYRKPGMQEIRA